MREYKIGLVTDRGHVRSVNQDRCLVCTGRYRGLSCALLAVADGMGGLSQGEKASSISVEQLRLWWEMLLQGQNPQIESVSSLLDQAIYSLHRRIYDLTEPPDHAGTTLSLLFLYGQRYLYKQIGDSRIYLYEKGSCRQITTDQTWCNDRVREGVLLKEQVSGHPMRHALSNALGVSEELRIATGTGQVARGASFLLCSDGFYSELTQEIEQGCWGKRQDPQRTLQEMMDRVLEGTAEDNATAVLCRIPYWI